MDQGLIDACQQGDIKALYALIRESPDILDLIDGKSFVDTPLHLAAKEGRTLVDTPLHLAATARRTRFALEIMMLKPSFARKLNQDGFSPVHLALQNGNTQMVLRLVRVDPDLVRVKGRGGITPLHYAAEIGDLPVLTEFLSVCPQSIEDLTIRAETALHVAVTNNMSAAFEVLLGWLKRGFYHGVRHLKEKVLNWQDDQGNSLLHIATSSNQPRVVGLLIKNGVNVNARNLEGLTALDILDQTQSETRNNIKVMLRNARAKKASSLENDITLADYLRSKALLFEFFVVYLMTGKYNMSNENRNAILVIAVLIVTATYQAGLTTPGGFLPVDQQPNITSSNGNTTTTTTTTTIRNHTIFTSLKSPGVTPLMNHTVYIIFHSANFTAFCASLGLIFLLVPSFVIFPLGYSLLGCYVFSLYSLSPKYFVHILYAVIFIPIFIFSCFIYRDYVRLSSCYRLIFSVHREKWSTQSQQHQMKFKPFLALSLLGHMLIIGGMVSTFWWVVKFTDQSSS